MLDTMRKLYFKEIHSGAIRRPLLILAGLLALTASGCGPDKSDGNIINETPLPTGARLDLQCEDVGIFNEPCVLDDKNNPFRTTLIKEFDPELPEDQDQETKFDQADELIPAGPEYAISRFYFWATALARRPDVGENQYYTALFLHELYTYGGGGNSGSENAREQALKAYRSVLDNYFGAATFFEQDDPDSDDPDDMVAYPVDLSQLTAFNLVTPADFLTLFPAATPADSELAARVELGDWGYSYVPPPPGELEPGAPQPLPMLIPINFIPNSP